MYARYLSRFTKTKTFHFFIGPPPSTMTTSFVATREMLSSSGKYTTAYFNILVSRRNILIIIFYLSFGWKYAEILQICPDGSQPESVTVASKLSALKCAVVHFRYDVNTTAMTHLLLSKSTHRKAHCFCLLSLDGRYFDTLLTFRIVYCQKSATATRFSIYSTHILIQNLQILQLCYLWSLY